MVKYHGKCQKNLNENKRNFGNYAGKDEAKFKRQKTEVEKKHIIILPKINSVTNIGLSMTPNKVPYQEISTKSSFPLSKSMKYNSKFNSNLESFANIINNCKILDDEFKDTAINLNKNTKLFSDKMKEYSLAVNNTIKEANAFHLNEILKHRSNAKY